MYEMSHDSTRKKTRAKGADLMANFRIDMPGKGKSDLITYREVAN